MKPTIRKRVLFLIENTSYPQDIRVLGEVETLKSNGYIISVICPARPGQSRREKVDGVYVFRYFLPPTSNTFWGYVLEYGYSLIATFIISIFVCFQPGFDIIHAANPPDMLVFIALFFKLFGKRFIFDHHDLSPELYNARSGGKGHPLVYRVLVWMEKLSCHFADHVIATNQSYKAIEIQRDNVPEGRITIVRNGPNFPLHLVDPELEIRQPEKTIIAYAGTIGFQDGVEHLIIALQYLIYDLGRRDLLCILLGDGDALPYMKSMSEELGLNEFVLFTGWVDHAQVLGYLNAADICIAPEPSNTYNDRSTMIKLMEYMAMGKPIVAFDLPEHQVSAQEAALFAKPNNDQDFAQQIVSLMDDPVRRIKMGQYGRERVEKELSWSHQENFLLEAYASIQVMKHLSA
jgi:glycosyltransferase involved in cell wall biosynthesis